MPGKPHQLPKRPVFKPKPKALPPGLSDDDEDDEPKSNIVAIKEDLQGDESDRERRIRILTTVPDEDLNMIKKWSCSFYNPGYPRCVGCRQPEDVVIECRDYYLERIPQFPVTEHWSKVFDLPVINVRKKVPLEELQEVGVTCDSCYMASKCPVMEAHSSCAIDFGVPESELTGPMVYNTLVKLQSERVKRQATFEKIDGGVADANLSNEMDRLARMVDGRDNRNNPGFKFTVEGTGGEGTKQAGGLLSQIFGAQKALPEATQDNTIDLPTVFAEPEFVEEKPKKRGKLKSAD